MILIRAYGDEIMFDEVRRNRLVQEAILILAMAITAKHKKVLEDMAAAIINYLARPSERRPHVPAFQMAFHPTEVVSLERIKKMSTAKYMLLHEGGKITKL